MEYFSTMTQNLHAIEKQTDIFDSIKNVFALENAIKHKIYTIYITEKVIIYLIHKEFLKFEESVQNRRKVGKYMNKNSQRKDMQKQLLLWNLTNDRGNEI